MVSFISTAIVTEMTIKLRASLQGDFPVYFKHSSHSVFYIRQKLHEININSDPVPT